MRIISLNAWGGAEWPELSRWLPGCDADVLFLQEVIRAPQPLPEWLMYKDPYRTLDQRGDLMADVSARLPGHQPYFAPAARGPLADATGKAFTTEHGLGAWVDRNLAVTGVAQSALYGRYRRDGWGDEPVPRALQGLRVCDPSSGQDVHVVNLHGLRDPSGKGDTPERDVQCAQLCNFIEHFWDGTSALVVMGDFNLLPDSATFSALRAMGLRDLISEYGITDTRTKLYTKPGRFADYAFVSAGVTVTSFSAPDHPVLSDHRPLILDIVP